MPSDICVLMYIYIFIYTHMFVCLYIDTASKTSHLLVVDLIAFSCTNTEFILGVSGNVMISYSRVFALFSPCVQSLDIIVFLKTSLRTGLEDH